MASRDDDKYTEPDDDDTENGNDSVIEGCSTKCCETVLVLSSLPILLPIRHIKHLRDAATKN